MSSSLKSVFIGLLLLFTAHSAHSMGMRPSRTYGISAYSESAEFKSHPPVILASTRFNTYFGVHGTYTENVQAATATIDARMDGGTTLVVDQDGNVSEVKSNFQLRFYSGRGLRLRSMGIEGPVSVRGLTEIGNRIVDINGTGAFEIRNGEQWIRFTINDIAPPLKIGMTYEGKVTKRILLP